MPVGGRLAGKFGNSNSYDDGDLVIFFSIIFCLIFRQLISRSLLQQHQRGDYLGEHCDGLADWLPHCSGTLLHRL